MSVDFQIVDTFSDFFTLKKYLRNDDVIFSVGSEFRISKKKKK